MIIVAALVLMLPDGRVVLQRRTVDAPTSPGKLSLFGGHIEAGESPETAVRRELGEETSLNPKDQKYKFLGTQKFIHQDTGEDVEFNYYLVNIDNTDFAVYEGDGAETYSLAEALERADLSLSTKYIFDRLAKSKL